MFDRETFFDSVRASLFGGSLVQSQVDGMSIMLSIWESRAPNADLRWFAYCMATAYHETAQTMQPVAEYGKGSGQSYGAVDPETGQAYYGRGYVQLTWRDNYHRADLELGLEGARSCEKDADLQLQAIYAAPTMFIGMYQGWFRSSDGAPETLGRYFNENQNNAFEAREIINGDKTLKPEWGGGRMMGDIIADYQFAFLTALEAAAAAAHGTAQAPKEPSPPLASSQMVTINLRISADAPVNVTVTTDELF